VTKTGLQVLLAPQGQRSASQGYAVHETGRRIQLIKAGGSDHLSTLLSDCEGAADIAVVHDAPVISNRVSIGPGNVKSHVKSILAKLGISCRTEAEAAAAAARRGLMNTEFADSNERSRSTR
jgi:hypothetical protein